MQVDLYFACFGNRAVRDTLSVFSNFSQWDYRYSITGVVHVVWGFKSSSVAVAHEGLFGQVTQT